MMACESPLGKEERASDLTRNQYRSIELVHASSLSIAQKRGVRRGNKVADLVRFLSQRFTPHETLWPRGRRCGNRFYNTSFPDFRKS